MDMTKISIGGRITLNIAALMGLTLLVAAISLWSMDKIGSEIEEIAKQDIPLTEIVTSITIHQLGQAILVEKGLAHADEGHLAEVKREFSDLGHQVDEEIADAQQLLEQSITAAHTADAKEEFLHLQSIMVQVGTEHHSFEKHGEEVFDLLVAGKKASAGEKVATLEGEQEKLNEELEAALIELEEFTEKSALTAEQDEKSAVQLISIVSAVGLLVIGITSFLLVRTIRIPLNSLGSVMEKLSENQTDIPVPFTGYHDEIGGMARAVEIFRQNAIEVKNLREQQDAQDRTAAEERVSLLTNIATQIEDGIGQVAQRMSSLSEQVKSSAQTLSANAQQTSSQSALVASASDKTTMNVQTVASAAEEMSSSVSEISRQVNQSTQVAQRAVQEVGTTNEKIQGLQEAANEIGKVVALIKEIADQTNLLALNATIEAARAGDAGKGFAVVASEVKNLAGQTAQATEQISTQVDNIQSATREAVEAIEEVGHVIEEINESSSAIATAVDEQGEVTREIASSAESASSGTQDVNSSISEVANLADTTGNSAGELLTASSEIGNDAVLLSEQVVELTRNLRSS